MRRRSLFRLHSPGADGVVLRPQLLHGEIHAFIRSKGGVPGDSVTKKTSCLVCGDKPGSKLQKAKELGITVLSPVEFFSLFEPIKQSQ